MTGRSTTFDNNSIHSPHGRLEEELLHNKLKETLPNDEFRFLFVLSLRRWGGFRWAVEVQVRALGYVQVAPATIADIARRLCSRQASAIPSYSGHAPEFSPS